MVACTSQREESYWTDIEREQIQSLWIGNLGEAPVNPGNAYADNPEAAELGRRLFSDPRLSRNGEIACVSCHQPDRYFTDALPVAEGLGKTQRNTPSVLGAAWSPWLFRDGRADSLWSQMLGPLEHTAEMGASRVALAQLVAQHYADAYRAVFPQEPALSMVSDLPANATPAGDEAGRQAWQALPAERREAVNRIASNIAKAVAAFERELKPAPSRFDEFAESLAEDDAQAKGNFTERERRGLKLFLGRGQCLRCHHGPLLTDQMFHNIGLGPLQGQAFDLGRSEGARALLDSEFNCRGPYSDAPLVDGQKECPHLGYLRPAREWVAAFRTPSLRNVAETGPYMHDGRFSSLAEVLEHYNKAEQIFRRHGHTELFPLGLNKTELAELEAFLHTLTGRGVTDASLEKPAVED